MFRSAMFSSFLCPLLLLLGRLLLLLLLSSPVGAETLYQICDTAGNYTTNSTYESNLKLLLSNLASNGSASGFLKDSVGQIPNQVHGLVLCRGDVNVTECASCLDIAIQDVQQICPFNKGAVVWYDFCLLRFSNQQFLSSTDNSDQEGMYNVNNITQPDRFSKLLYPLLNDTAEWAANSTKKFGTGEMSNFTSEFPTIYSLMQCTPDVSTTQCRQCLRDLFDPLPSYMVGKQGARIIGVRCSMRYEVYSFFEGAPSLKLTAPVNATAPPTPRASPPVLIPPPATGGEEGKLHIVSYYHISSTSSFFRLLIPK